MNEISICLATRNPILYGAGTSARTGDELRRLGVSRALIVCDKGVADAGILERIQGNLDAAGVEYVVYDGVQPDPPDWSCEAAAELGRNAGVNGVLAVGGGSSLDTGKAARVLLTNPPPISRYYLAHEDVQPDESSMVPIVVLPTTAGTGSEATPGGVITDTATNTKHNVPCATSLGIVDPELTLTLPLNITAITAIDALCHSVEAYTSNKPNAISDILCVNAVKMIGESLPLVFENPNDLEARAMLHLSGTLGGLGLMGPFCHIPHEIGLIIGAELNIPHGVACGLFLPEALRRIAEAVPQRVAQIAGWLGVEQLLYASPNEIGQNAYDAVTRLYRLINFPVLADYATRDQVRATVKQIMDPYPFVHCPVTLTEDDVELILTETYDSRW